MNNGFGRKGLSEKQGLSASPPRPSRVPQDIARFDVTPHPMKMVLMVFFGLGGAVVMLNEMLDPRGLILNRIIHFSPFSADIFFGVLLLACLGLAGFGALAFARSFGDRIWLSLDNHAVTGPSSFGSRTQVRMRFVDIRDARVQTYQKQQYMTLRAHDGRKIRIGTAHFRQSDEWPVFLKELQRRWAG